MRCPKCNGFFNLIVSLNQVDNETKTLRHYECQDCKDAKFSTLEIQLDEYKKLYHQAHKNVKSSQ